MLFRVSLLGAAPVRDLLILQQPWGLGIAGALDRWRILGVKRLGLGYAGCLRGAAGAGCVQPWLQLQIQLQTPMRLLRQWLALLSPYPLLTPCQHARGYILLVYSPSKQSSGL